MEERVRNAWFRMPNFVESEKLVHRAEVFSGTNDLFAEENMHEVKKQYRLVYKVSGTMGMNLSVGRN